MASSPAPTPRPGDRLAAATGSTRVIVIRAPEDATATVECGGVPMLPARQVPAGPPTSEVPGTLGGKRYVDAADTLELL
jgi:hypothetical protein